MCTHLGNLLGAFVISQCFYVVLSNTEKYFVLIKKEAKEVFVTA